MRKTPRFRASSLRKVGLWRSWERASMAWKRSSVRSRPGPPKSLPDPRRFPPDGPLVLVKSIFFMGKQTRAIVSNRSQLTCRLGVIFCHLYMMGRRVVAGVHYAKGHPTDRGGSANLFLLAGSVECSTDRPRRRRGQGGRSDEADRAGKPQSHQSTANHLLHRKGRDGHRHGTPLAGCGSASLQWREPQGDIHVKRRLLLLHGREPIERLSFPTPPRIPASLVPTDQYSRSDPFDDGPEQLGITHR